MTANSYTVDLTSRAAGDDVTSPTVCPYCLAPADGALVVCEHCRAPHHADCFAEAGKCAVLGCSTEGGHEGTSATAGLPGPAASAPPRDLAAGSRLTGRLTESEPAGKSAHAPGRYPDTDTPSSQPYRNEHGLTTPSGGAPGTQPMPGQPPGPLWFRRLRAGWSTVLLTGLAATLSQLAALAMAGLELAEARPWVSGGLVALLGGLWVSKRAATWDSFKRAIWIPVVLASALSFLLVGLQNSYDVEIVDREARPATQSLQPTGNYDVVETSERICEPGDDYLSCVNAHVANYNSVCVGQPLTWLGDSRCASMSQFIDEAKAVYDTCEYGCTTGGDPGDEWGWTYLRLEAETAMQSNNDAQPRVTHTERCSFDLGVIQIGTCD